MTDPSLPPADLAELRRRWEERPTPQLAVQLAEAHRRRSEPEQAVEVLEKAVTDSPSHLSVRVALGRLRVQLGDLAAAGGDLEQVVERDPTHLVANKLLVRVYAGLGQPLRARDRLDLYQLLNESDPEIEELEALVPPPGVLAPEPGETPPAPGAHEGKAAADDAPAPPAGGDETAELPEIDLFAGAPPSGRAATPTREGDPFPSLWDDLDADGYWQRVDAGGVFGPRAEPAAEEPAAETAAEAAGPVPTGEALEPRLREAPPEKPQPAEAPAEAVHEVVPAAPEEPRAGAASVTLAALYRQQGHRDEARRIYREVLEREPGNRDALTALAELARSEPSRLTAFDLVDELPADSAARKSRVLKGYLERLRGGGEPGV